MPGARGQVEASPARLRHRGHLARGLTSGAFVTDPSNASRTMLYNLHSGHWDAELLSLFRVPANLLPEVRASSEVLGEVNTALGLSGVPLAGLAGDQQAALFGQMCVRPGLAKNTYGTGCFLLQNVGTKPLASKRRLITSVAWRLAKREFALEAMSSSAAQWCNGCATGSARAHRHGVC